MRRSRTPEVVSLLLAAKESPHGVSVKTNNLDGLRQKLYVAMRKAPDLKRFTLTPDPSAPREVLMIIPTDQYKENSDGG